jgi:hypothetical protein
MRYLLGAVFLASCTALTPSPTGNASLERPAPEAAPAPAASPLPEGEQETRKPKPKVSPAPPAAEISSCANLDMGDVKETVRAKLDCISENAK